VLTHGIVCVNVICVQECVKRKQTDNEVREVSSSEQTATLYFCDDEDDVETPSGACKEGDYGRFPLPDV